MFLRLINFFVLIYFLTQFSSSALRLFSHGRRFNGNLGDPSPVANKLDLGLPADEWFDQNLDHFDPTSSKTWKQVF